MRPCFSTKDYQDEYNNDTNRNDEDDKEGAIYDGEGVQANPLVRRTRLEREQKRLEDETRVDGYRTSRSRNGYSNVILVLTLCTCEIPIRWARVRRFKRGCA